MEYGTSPIFNIADLYLYHGEPPATTPPPPPELTESTSSTRRTTTVTPATTPLVDRVDAVVDREEHQTRRAVYWRYLVTWQGRDYSDRSWITEEELRDKRPDLYQEELRQRDVSDPDSVASPGTEDTSS